MRGKSQPGEVSRCNATVEPPKWDLRPRMRTRIPNGYKGDRRPAMQSSKEVQMISHRSLGRTLVRVAVSATLVLAPAAVLAAPAIAAPLVLQPAEETPTSTDQTQINQGDPIHRGGRGHRHGHGHSGSAGSC